MDLITAATMAGIRPDALRAIFATVLRRFWGRRLQGVARRILGGRVQHHAAELPQLGSPDPAPDLLGGSPGVGRLMCRHLGWLGKPRSIASLVLEPPSGLRSEEHTSELQ